MALILPHHRGLLVPKPYVGQVATRCFFPQAFYAANLDWMARSYHFALDNIGWMKVCFANFYVNDSFAETGSGAATTITAGLEYPNGSFKPILFSGSSTGTIADNAYLWSDWFYAGVASGSKFYIRQLRKNSSGIVFNSDGPLGTLPRDVTGGDACEQTSTDKTISGTVNDTAGGSYIGPCAIVGQTFKPSFSLVGDSRVFGYGDTNDASGDLGELARSIGPSFGYINAGRSSSNASTFVTNSALRRAILAYCSHVICEHGICDIVLLATAAATVEANILAIAALFKPRPVWWSTLSPVSSGTFTSAGGQTTDATNSTRNTVNTWISGSPTGLAGYVDVNSAVENSPGDGKWVAPGGVAQTGDGTHANQTGNLRIASQGVVKPSAFHFDPGAVSYLPQG